MARIEVLGGPRDGEQIWTAKIIPRVIVMIDPGDQTMYEYVRETAIHPSAEGPKRVVVPVERRSDGRWFAVWAHRST